MTHSHAREEEGEAAEREEERSSTFAWLLRLRWLAVMGQLVTIGIVRWALGIQIVLTPLLAVVAIEALSNALASRSLAQSHVTDARLGSLLALDVLILATTKIAEVSAGQLGDGPYLFYLSETLER